MSKFKGHRERKLKILNMEKMELDLKWEMRKK